MFAYLITNAANGKKYVGIAKDAADRWRRHLAAAQGGRPRHAINRAMAKHGCHLFSFEVVACARTWDDLAAVEAALIRQHDSRLGSGRGYNMTDGGDGTYGRRHTEEAKALIRAARLARTMSAETGAKISAALRGLKRTPEQRERYRAATLARGGFTPEMQAKAAASRTGRKLSPEHRAALSAARKGKPKSAEHRAAIGAAHRGKTHSPELRAKMSEGRRAGNLRRAAEAAAAAAASPSPALPGDTA